LRRGNRRVALGSATLRPGERVDLINPLLAIQEEANESDNKHAATNRVGPRRYGRVACENSIGRQRVAAFVAIAAFVRITIDAPADPHVAVVRVLRIGAPPTRESVRIGRG